ncbi:hypothetical protein [Winogradskya humida]|uniref:Glutamine cyclotransferase n=1 Tax=Winogradskya humida TaxID=113566 RepID=A0ABQ4A127_9ACTN|nr:hypothetical protein [Actinoplanes humidus]GIE24570.1 hypothetical protein Ahu01nite_076720 [Actinoplanes humidus]
MTTPTTRVAAVQRSLPAPGTYMCGLTWDGEVFWHSDQEALLISALDPVTGAVQRSFTNSWVRADLTTHDGELYQIGGRPKRLVRIAPQAGEVLGHVTVAPPSGRLCGVEAAPEGVWMALRSPDVVQLRDYATMEVQREIPIEAPPSGLTRTPGLIVFGEYEDGLLHAIDRDTGKPCGRVRVEGRPTGLTYDGEHVWYCDFPARALKAVRVQDLVEDHDAA